MRRRPWEEKGHSSSSTVGAAPRAGMVVFDGITADGFARPELAPWDGADRLFRAARFVPLVTGISPHGQSDVFGGRRCDVLTVVRTQVPVARKHLGTSPRLQATVDVCLPLETRRLLRQQPGVSLRASLHLRRRSGRADHQCRAAADPAPHRNIVRETDKSQALADVRTDGDAPPFVPSRWPGPGRVAQDFPPGRPRQFFRRS